MLKRLILPTLLALVLVAAFTLPMAFAQGSRGEPVDEAAPQENIPQGLNDPPSGDYTRLYMFSGAFDNLSNVATVVHCSNYGNEDAQVYVEFFDVDGSTAANVFTATTIIPVNETRTFSTSPTELYVDHALAGLTSDAIDQGAGRVLVPITNTSFICGAQLIDSTTITPSFSVNLELFEK